MATGHLDKRTVKRMGYFRKEDDAMPKYKDYGKTCKNAGAGYLGPRHEAHHILPQTAIEESVSESGKDVRYIEDVQYITDWNINSPTNLIGLPTYHSYDQYYQGATRLVKSGLSERADDLVAWFNKFSAKTRKKWLREFGAHNPEGHPIHNPVNWGHTDYNEKVMEEIKTQVWDRLNDKKKKHELDSKTVEGVLNKLANRWRTQLTNRGTGTQKMWDRRFDKNDDDWYKPFTMTKVRNPLFG